MRRLSVALILPLVLSLFSLAALLAPAAPVEAAESACFPETGQCAENAFLAFWRTHGALEVLGMPISQAFVDDRGLIVQFYERAIMEWHPENPPEYQVLLRLLAAERLGERAERYMPAEPCDGACVWFAETGHTLRGAFLNYWQAYGGLAVFGFPLTEQFAEVNPADGRVYMVQYFERNRFEWHPENAGSRYEVLLGLLGWEVLDAQPELLGRPAVGVPEYAGSVVGTPVRLAIPAIGVDAPIVPVGVDAYGNMSAPQTAWDTAWYAAGPRPGELGNAVIAGHVDFRGVGAAVFWDVRTLGPGAEIWVTGDNGSLRRFVVQSVESYYLDEAPRERIFGPDSSANLNLISCVGNFDPATRSYDRRIVVYARWDGVAR